MANGRRSFGLLAFALAFFLGASFMGMSLVRSSTSALAGAPVTPLVPLDGTESLPPGTTIETLLTGMNFPIAMAFDPAGRLFYTEKTTGNVRLFANGVLQPNPVITYSVDGTCSERGLLGIAIDPNFNSNHYIYVYYTAWPGSQCGATTNRVARFVENNGIGSSSVDIFTSTQTAGNHNGGNIHFGPDGKLYISIGDNANAANSQNVTVKNGKMHRINPDGTIPSDNPVFTQTGALASLYAIGLRNSFDFTFDGLTPGRIFASENGPSCDDEMNRIEAGWNYGWRSSYPCDDANPSPQYNTIPPLWYLGSGVCCEAPTGIVVYTGTQIPQWTGHLFMETFRSGTNSLLRHMYLNAARTVLTQTNVVNGINVGTDIENGPDGALWYIQGGGYVAGTLKRIVAAGPTSSPTITPTFTNTRTPTITPTPPCPTNVVANSIVDFAFVPMTMTIHVGDSVRWTNYDLDYHTSTSDDPLWDSGNIQQNQSYTFTFNSPGTYGYYCIPHPWMRGAIVVQSGCAPVTSTPTNTPTSTFTPTPLCDSFHYLTPEAGGPANGGTVGVGDRFTLDMMIKAGPYILSSHQAFLTYTNSLLQNVRATQSGCVLTNTITSDLTVFDLAVQNQVCPGPGSCVFGPVTDPPGSINFVSTAAGNPPYSGPDFRVARIGFCAISPGQARIHWRFSPPEIAARDTEIFEEFGAIVNEPPCYVDYVINIVSATATPTVTSTPVNTATNTPTNTATNTATNTPVSTPTPFDQDKLIGHVTWQGRPAQPNALQSLPLTVTLHWISGGTNFDYPATTDASGFFTLSVGLLPNGNYTWRAKGPQYLASSGNLSLTDIDVHQELGVQLAGDASGDNCVNITDFNIVKASFGRSVGDPDYDPRADFTGDNTITILDYNLLRSNFALCGAPPLRIAPPK